MAVQDATGQAMQVEPLIDMVLGLVPDAAVVVDETGTIVSLNDNVGELFGYGLDDLCGQPVEVLVPERFRHRHRRQRTGFLADPKVRSMGAGLELFGRRRDGTEFPVDISLAPISTADRRLVVAAIRDISERRAIEAAHAQLAAIVRSSLDAIFAITIDGRITNWNPGAERTLGFADEEMIGAHVSRLIPPDSSARFEEQLERAQRGEPGPPVDSEWLTRSAARLPVAVSVSPMVDSAGTLTGFSVLLRDITQAKEAERELRRLLAVSEHHANWQEASAEIRLAILGGRPLEEVLQLIADRGHDLTSSSGVALVRAGQVVAAAGTGCGLLGTEVTLPLRVEDDKPVHAVPRVELEGMLAEALEGVLALVVPIHGDRAGSALVLDSLVEEGSERFEEVEWVAAGLGDHAALAFELERARADRERLLLSDERERIARDLHDHAVQALFATGLSLQSILPLVENSRAAERVLDAVDSLDATIKQIRTAIFTLSAPPAGRRALRADLVRLAAEVARGLGFEPAVSFDGPVDNAIPPSIATHIVAVVREALSNVARHAGASSASVSLRVTPLACELTVVDDGAGFDTAGVGNGLANLGARAESLGGGFEVDSTPGRGTRLRWHVPLG